MWNTFEKGAYFSTEHILVNNCGTLLKKVPFTLDRRGCKKAFFSTEYIWVNKCGTLLKKGAIELSLWIEEDVKKLTFQQNIFGSTTVEHF